jgi:VanZ family protein
MSDRVMWLVRWLPVMVVTTVWLIGTHLPTTRVPAVGSGDKLVHFAGYACIALMLTWALRLDRRSIGAMLMAWVGLLVLGAMDELTQPWVGRSAQWADLFANAGGAIVGLIGSRGLLRMMLGRGQRVMGGSDKRE